MSDRDDEARMLEDRPVAGPLQRPVWRPGPERSKFARGDLVRKRSGSQWQGRVVGEYSTALTPEGYAVESDSHPGSVQIYPAAALELAEPRKHWTEDMSMTNDELRQAIEDANKLARTTAPDSPVHNDVVKHVRALLAEQQRRAALPATIAAPTGPLWVQPVIVQPTWVPRDPWTPPYEITCSTQ